MLPSRWLLLHPTIAKAIVWEGGRGRPISYPNWTALKKRQLDQMYRGQFVLPATPPANLLKMGDDDYPETRIAEADAWPLYLSYVAASLGCEIGGKVPWSILDYPAAALAILLDSREMFQRTSGLGAVVSSTKSGYDQPGYQFDRLKTGFSLPAPAAMSLAFLAARGIWPEPDPLHAEPKLPTDPATARRNTAYRMIDWCRSLIHFGGGFEVSNVEKYWHYRGDTPAVRMMEPTVKTGDTIAQSYTFGCWGTVGFIRSVLRAINLPVEQPYPSGHASLWLPLEGKGLVHGDDPYMRRQRYLPEQVPTYTPDGRAFWSPIFPVSELMIDQAEFDALFGPAVPEAARENNVGAVNKRIALKYLPYRLLQDYCADLAAGTTNKLIDSFGGHLTEAEAEAAQLRPRLAAKLPSIGGCAAFG